MDHGNCGFRGKRSHKLVVFKQEKKDDSLLPVIRFQYLMCHFQNIDKLHGRSARTKKEENYILSFQARPK